MEDMHLNNPDVVRPSTKPLRQHLPAFGNHARRQAAIVINPTKFRRPMDMAMFQQWAEHEFQRHGWRCPLWLPTTSTTRGRTETRQALETGADIVVAAGGDGTIRAVADGTMNGDIPMALLPIGTGNLLARNLGINPSALDEAVAVICQGRDNVMDVGWLEVDKTGRGVYGDRQTFLVMAGSGFDAATMHGATEKMKRLAGQAAYIISGLRSAGRPRTQSMVFVDHELVLAESSHGLIVGNCGRLAGDVSLMHDADPADGLLDGVALLPSKLSDWVKLVWAIHPGKRCLSPLMPRVQGTRIEMLSKSPQPVQVDGDVIGHAYGIRAGLYPGALRVRRPAELPVLGRSLNAANWSIKDEVLLPG